MWCRRAAYGRCDGKEFSKAYFVHANFLAFFTWRVWVFANLLAMPLYSKAFQAEESLPSPTAYQPRTPQGWGAFLHAHRIWHHRVELEVYCGRPRGTTAWEQYPASGENCWSAQCGFGDRFLTGEQGWWVFMQHATIATMYLCVTYIDCWPFHLQSLRPRRTPSPVPLHTAMLFCTMSTLPLHFGHMFSGRWRSMLRTARTKTSWWTWQHPQRRERCLQDVMLYLLALSLSHTHTHTHTHRHNPFLYATPGDASRELLFLCRNCTVSG